MDTFSRICAFNFKIVKSSHIEFHLISVSFISIMFPSIWISNYRKRRLPAKNSQPWDPPEHAAITSSSYNKKGEGGKEQSLSKLLLRIVAMKHSFQESNTETSSRKSNKDGARKARQRKDYHTDKNNARCNARWRIITSSRSPNIKKKIYDLFRCDFTRWDREAPTISGAVTFRACHCFE